jgi:hypothetical protein
MNLAHNFSTGTIWENITYGMEESEDARAWTDVRDRVESAAKVRPLPFTPIRCWEFQPL